MSIALSAPEKYCQPEISSWKKWIRDIQNFLVASGIEDDKRKKATLLHHAGSEINDIFDTLCKEDGSDTFKETVDKITNHLEPKKNTAFNRYSFRSMKQQEGENMKSYVIRLKEASLKCEFDQYSAEEAIIEQIVVNCLSDTLRKKILEAGSGKNITLDTVLNAANVEEETQVQMSELKKSTREVLEEDYCVNEEVNYNNVNKRSNFRPSSSRDVPPSKDPGKVIQYRQNKPSHLNNSFRSNDPSCTDKCPNCGYTPHKSMVSCPAKGKTCSHCQGPNHFWSVCWSRAQGQPPRQNRQTKPQQTNLTNEGNNSPGNYLFNTTSHHTTSPHTLVNIIVEGVPVSMIADSGSTTNMIDLETFQLIKSKSRKIIPLHHATTTIKAYGSNNSLPISGYFSAKVEYEDQTHLLNFYVINKLKAGNLLSKKTLLELGILSFNIPSASANLTSSQSAMWDEFPSVTTGIGRALNFQKF